MHIRKVVAFGLILGLLAVGISAQEEQAEQSDPEQQQQEREIPAAADGWVALDNVGRQEWRVADSGGTGVYATAGGATVALEVGGTYYFDLSAVDSDHMPFALVGLTGDILLSQEDGDQQTPPEGVNAEVDGEGMQFEFTEDFAERVARFRAIPYPSMVGFISAFGFAEDVEEEQDAQEGTQQEGEGRQS